MKLKVLLIEINNDPETSLKNMLPSTWTEEEPFYFETYVVGSISSAITRILEGNFDIILYRLETTDLQDVETLTRMNQRYGAVPIIMVDYTNEKSLLHQAYQWGVEEFITQDEFSADFLKRSLYHTSERRKRMIEAGNLNNLGILKQHQVKSSEDVKILIVEDDEDQIRLLEVLLGKLSYILRSVTSGEEAIEVAAEFKPDIILADLNLPGINGVEMAKQLHQTTGLENIPVIMISADIEENTVVNALAHGIYDFVGKPLRTGELTLRIGNLLHLMDNRRQLADMALKLEKEKNILAKYFSQDFVEKLINEEIDTNLGGKEVVSSIMFFDLRNSTGIAEMLDPDTFTNFLSQMWNDIMDIVLSNGGSVNKLMGDGMLATFGCPEPGKKDPLNCVTSAIKIRDYFKLYNEISPHDLKDIRFGIGIATGKVFAGNIGSFRRMEYTVMGDPVNIASRLEGLTKKAGVDILIDGNTRYDLADLVRVRRVRANHVRGRVGHLDIFALDEFK